ncbi:RNA methyltransferase [Thiovibrio sp. JS02]
MRQEAPEAAKKLMANAAIVMVRPKFAENVGSAARTAMNMGIGGLILVAPEMPEREKMLRLATHNAAHLIDAIERYDDLSEALAPFAWVIGTSARQGRKRSTCKSPRQIMAEVKPQLAKNRVALLFGPEDSGLASEDLRYCNQVTTIPTADFSSLNLAQAVAILCHELHYSLLEELAAGELAARPRQAAKGELEAMYAHVEEVLLAVGFLKNREDDYWMQSIRQFLGRLGLRSKEIRIIRGFCRQLLWRESRRDAGGPNPGRKEVSPGAGD